MNKRIAVGCLVVFAAACAPSTHPNKGRYSCAETKDCGAGFECRPQFAGGQLCFQVGECTDVEQCNGVDDTCDGRVDETFPDAGAGCSSGALGLCATGELVCQFGSVGCRQTVFAVDELCNGLDDDCDGVTDETFDLVTDSRHCGACGQACDAGTSCAMSRCLETACDDGVDNDTNGAADCDDDVCFGQPCDNAVQPPRRCGIVFPTDGGAADGGAADGGAADGGAADGGAADGGAADGGATDGGAADGGAAGVRGCFLPETQCANGVDDDGDGLADCLDPDCDGRACVSGTTCTARMCPGPG